jgi:signal transduction histidine kinase
MRAMEGNRLRAGLRLVTHSLSGRLLLLTLAYVLITEVLIFVPAIGRYHRNLLDDHIKSAELAVLPFSESSGANAPPEIQKELLARADAAAVALKRKDVRNFYLVGKEVPKVDLTIDLQKDSLLSEIGNAIDCIVNGGNRGLHIVAWTQIKDTEAIDIFLRETQIRADLIGYARNIAALALLISLATALLVFASLYVVVVRPIRQLTRGMITFHENPEDPSRIITPSDRRDEIGIAERELAVMQRDLYGSLQQKNRLAALGVAVAKIQHDLKNILANAQLASDRLAAVDDPVVQRLAPRLVASLDRAVSLATSTLRFGRAEEREPARMLVPLLPILEEAAQSAVDTAKADNISLRIDVDPEVRIDADTEQLFRIALNLTRNAVDALTPRGSKIEIAASRAAGRVTFDISDDGPGIPEQVRARLFQPFASTARAGGSGLGLAIARDLARAHGGDIDLVSTSDTGTTFRVTIPDRK